MAGTLVLDTLQNGAGTASTSADNVIRGCAKAWVSFTGSTGSINASYNVSSITRNSTGSYTINITTALPSISYCAVATAAIPSWQAYVINLQSKTTTSFLVQYGYGTSPTFGDAADMNVSVFSS